MKYGDFKKIIEENRWIIIRQKGSHVFIKKGNIRLPIPILRNKDIGKGLANEIIKELTK